MTPWKTALISALLLVGCGQDQQREWRPEAEETAYLQEWAGRIARSLVPPGSPNAIAPEDLQELASYCDSVPARYVYLYQQISDSIMALPPPSPECVSGGASPDTTPAQPSEPTMEGEPLPDSAFGSMERR